MTFRETVRSLRFICDVLKEYLATEQRKRAAATKLAEEAARHKAEETAAREAARRKAEEAAAREAERKATQERLLAEQASKSTEHPRPRHGDGPRASIPTGPAQVPASTATDLGGLVDVSWLPPGVQALITELGRLDAAIRNLFTVTETSRAWFEKVSVDPQSGLAIQALMAGLLMAAQEISRRMFHRERLLAWQRRWIDNVKRVERMLDGDWREKVHYTLWSNEQRQARQAPMAPA